MNQRQTKMGNRISGLAMIVFGGIIASAGSIPLDVGAAYFIAEGAGDLVSGENHYLGARVINYISRGRIPIR